MKATFDRRFMRGLRGWAAGMVLVAAACGELDECENLPTSFQLDFSLADPALGPEVAFVAITVFAQGLRWRERFPTADALEDGSSSIAVTVTPAPASAFELTVQVAALDVGTSTLAQASASTTARPNGCNVVALELR